jgi:hypothetical protein
MMNYNRLYMPIQPSYILPTRKRTNNTIVIFVIIFIFILILGIGTIVYIQNTSKSAIYITPSTVPSTVPSTTPSTTPSTVPSTTPSTVPSTTPSTVPSTVPSTPSTTPSTTPITVRKGCNYKWEYDGTYYRNNGGFDENGSSRLVAKVINMGSGGQNNCPVKNGISTLLYNSQNAGRTATSKSFYSENPYVEPPVEDPTKKQDCVFRFSFQDKDAGWCGRFYTHEKCPVVPGETCKTAKKFTILKQPKNGGKQCPPMEDGKYYCEKAKSCGQFKCPSARAGSSNDVITGVLPVKKDSEPQWSNILSNLISVGPNKNGIETYIGRSKMDKENIFPGKILDGEFNVCYVDSLKFYDDIEYLIYDREYMWEKIYQNNENFYPVIGGKTNYDLLYICRGKYNDRFYLGTYNIDGTPTNFKIMTDDGLKTDVPENDIEYLLY